MRPVRRSVSPIPQDYYNYKDAKPELISRIGSGWASDIHLASYCSYCERKIETNLAVEHIEPKKGPHAQPHLVGTWANFLLACVNCNSTKKDKRVDFNTLYFPDRDNTFEAFEYLADGNIQPTNLQDQIALQTLALTGLDKERRQTLDTKDRVIAEDRSSQRMQIWKQAETCLANYNIDPNNQAVVKLIVSNAVLAGFFSVWITVFEGVVDMRNLFIDAFAGTRGSSCFDPITTGSITPAPNPDQLQGGGKI